MIQQGQEVNKESDSFYVNNQNSVPETIQAIPIFTGGNEVNQDHGMGEPTLMMETPTPGSQRKKRNVQGEHAGTIVDFIDFINPIAFRTD